MRNVLSDNSILKRDSLVIIKQHLGNKEIKV